MGFKETVSEHFAGYMNETDYVDRTYKICKERGFDGPSTIACVGVCRDELTRPFAHAIQETWGEAFNFACLGGMVFLGKTGFLAAQQHAPIENGRRRFAFIGMTHIGIPEEGEIGECFRRGVPGPSSACGAQVAFRQGLLDGKMELQLDRDDLEQSLLRQRLLRKIRYGDIPDLATITKLTHEAIIEDMERMIDLTVDLESSDYVFLTGVQIHGPEETDYVWPGAFYTVVGKQRKDHMAQLAAKA